MKKIEKIEEIEIETELDPATNSIQGGITMLQGLALLVVIGKFAFAIAAFVLIILLIRRLLADERDRKERKEREHNEDK